MEILAHWQSFDLKVAAAVFFAYLLIDAAYAYYTLAVTKNKGSSGHSPEVLSELALLARYCTYISSSLGRCVREYSSTRSSLAEISRLRRLLSGQPCIF